MSPEVIRRKMGLLLGYLNDLRPYESVDFTDFMKNHYAVERILELMVITATDLLFHLFSERGEAEPDSYAAAFRRAGETGLLDTNLAGRLARLAGMRNILVHGYEAVDYRIVHGSIQPAVADFGLFLKAVHAAQKSPESP